MHTLSYAQSAEATINQRHCYFSDSQQHIKEEVREILYMQAGLQQIPSMHTAEHAYYDD
jgi:hypothetical protein